MAERRRKINYRHLGEVSTKDARYVVGGVMFLPPIKALTVLCWVLEKVIKIDRKHTRGGVSKAA